MKLVFDPILGGGGDQNSSEGVKFCVGICLAHIKLVSGGQLAAPKKNVFLGQPTGRVPNTQESSEQIGMRRPSREEKRRAVGG